MIPLGERNHGRGIEAYWEAMFSPSAFRSHVLRYVSRSPTSIFTRNSRPLPRRTTYIPISQLSSFTTMKSTPTVRKLTENPNVRCLLEKKIGDINDLQKRLQDCAFVAFDTEGVGRGFNELTPHGEDASELGAAILRPNERIPHFATSCLDFYKQNNIEAFTLRLSPRNSVPAVGTLKSVRPEKAGSALYNALNHIKGPRILLGWDLRHEFQWIASAYPELSNLFTEWCDVQDLVMQLQKSICQGHGEAVLQPALIRTARSMGIHDCSPYANHIAANDCVKSLTVLSGLFHGIASDSDKCRGPSSVQVFLYLP